MGWMRWAALGAVILAFSQVEAHGPTRQKVRDSIEVNAPVDKVWVLISNFADQSWNPAVAKTEAHGGNEVGATRTTTLKNGAVVTETLEAYQPDKYSFATMIMKIDVAVMPVTNYYVRVTLKPTEGGKTLVEWNSAFYRGYPNNDPPANLNDEAAVKAVKELLRVTLEDLKKSVETPSG